MAVVSLYIYNRMGFTLISKFSPVAKNNACRNYVLSTPTKSDVGGISLNRKIRKVKIIEKYGFFAYFYGVDFFLFQVFFDLREHPLDPCIRAIGEITGLSKATLNNLSSKTRDTGIRHALQGILYFDKQYYKIRLQVERDILQIRKRIVSEHFQIIQILQFNQSIQQVLFEHSPLLYQRRLVLLEYYEQTCAISLDENVF